MSRRHTDFNAYAEATCQRLNQRMIEVIKNDRRLRRRARSQVSEALKPRRRHTDNLRSCLLDYPFWAMVLGYIASLALVWLVAHGVSGVLS